MRISVDISLYPLTEDYAAPILAFIARLENNPAIEVERNNLSTQVFGEYRDVFDAMDSEIEALFEKLPHSVFVLKMIGTDRQQVEDE